MKKSLVQLSESLVFVCIGLAAALTWSTKAMHAEQPLGTLRLTGPMSSAAISPEGGYIAVNIGSSVQKADGSWDSTESIQVLELTASKVVAKVDLVSAALLKDAPLSSTEGSLGYCDNGRYLAAFDEIGTVYVLNARSYEVESKIRLGELPHVGTRGVTRMVCSANSSLLAVNAYGGQFGFGLVRLFDLTSGRQVAELRRDSSSGIEFKQISISPSGSRLAILLANPKGKRINGPNVEIHETKELKLLSSFSTGDIPPGLTFSGDSQVVTVQEQPARGAPSKKGLRLWDIESGNEVRQFSDAHVGVDWPTSSTADGRRILGYIPSYRECRFCNGLEGRRDVKEQRFAVWDKITGAEIYRSEPFRPIVEPLGPQPVLSQDGTAAMVYWPDNVITPRLFPIP